MIGAECTAIVSSRSVGFGMKAVALLQGCPFSGEERKTFARIEFFSV
jgi:hypothetical protein